ncbi:uncharacterized protein RNJ42_00062 [Nakaseomyces bracarensis]|uniref:uncharacterized protein n=1 Tax=Nakaseomyces bracarensis TaxID=273131 RepID=UPI003871D0FD
MRIDSTASQGKLQVIMTGDSFTSSQDTFIVNATSGSGSTAYYDFNSFNSMHNKFINVDVTFSKRTSVSAEAFNAENSNIYIEGEYTQSPSLTGLQLANGMVWFDGQLKTVLSDNFHFQFIEPHSGQSVFVINDAVPNQKKNIR